MREVQKIKMEGVMRKKLMSCLVAFAFVMSIAAPSAFAAPGTNGVSDTSGGPSASLSIPQEEGLNEANANPTVSRIKSVFNYMGGQLVSIGDAARGITLLSNGKVFATLSYNFEDGSYTVGSINIDGMDADKIEKAGGLKNFLLSLGIPESALQAQPSVYDENGNPVNITADTSDEQVSKLTNGKYKNYSEYLNRPKEDVVWLTEAANALKGGINQGISINFAANGGASVTIMENGKPQVSYSATAGPDGKLFKTGEYVYVNGFLSEIKSYGFEIDYVGSSATKEEGAKAAKFAENRDAWLVNNPGKTSKDYMDTLSKDDENMAAYAKATNVDNIKYKIATTITHFNAYGQASHVSKDGKTINTYNYGVNGSMMSSYDATTKSTTYYANNQASFVTNDKGAMLNKYNYNPNGTLNNVVGYNNGTAVTITAFAFNKELATANLSAGSVTADEIRKAYAQLTTPGIKKAYHEIVSQYHLTGIQVYAGHLNNTALMNFILNPENKKDDKDVALALKVMKNNNNGISPVASASFVFGTKPTSYEIDGKKFATEKEAKEYMFKSMSVAQRKSQLKDADGKSVVDENGNLLDGKKIEDIDFGKSTDSKISGHAVKQVTSEVLTIETTVNSYGAPSFTMVGECKIKDNGAQVIGGYHDPAVVGVVDSFVDANGNVIENVDEYLKQNPDAKVYAKVSAEGINMMDGSGFKAAAGEEIFVEISADQAAELSIGKEAMFMGDVSQSSNGQYVMRTNENYSVTVDGTTYKGFVTGKDLGAAKSEVQKESMKALNGESKYEWMNINTKTNRELFSLGSGSYLNDWKAGWAILAGWNN